jgi:hypothetical protein
MLWEEEEVRSSWDMFVLRYTDHYARSGGCPSKKKSLVAIFDNVLTPKLTNMAKSMVGFSKNPAILFAIFRRGPSAIHLASTWRRCLSVFQDRDKNMRFFYEKVHHPP